MWSEIRLVELVVGYTIRLKRVGAGFTRVTSGY